MKNLLLSLLTASTITIPAFAETILYVDEATNLRYNLNTETQTAEIYANYARFEETTLIVPQSVTVDGISYTITVVGNFQSSPNLEELIITHPVELSEGSFDQCSKLSSITLPEGITHIPNRCFAGTAITNIDFLPSSVKTIGTRADFFNHDNMAGEVFSRCSSLKSVTLKPSVESLCAYAFSDCTSLEEVNLNDGLQSMGQACFFDIHF